MVDLLAILEQAEAVLDRFDQQTDGDADDYYARLAERLQRTKSDLLTSLLKMAAELGLVVQSPDRFYFEPSYVQPILHIKRSKLSRQRWDISAVVANTSLYSELVESLLVTLEQHVGASLSLLERSSTLLEQPNKIEGFKEKRGVPLDLPLEDVHFGDLLYRRFRRADYKCLGDVLERDMRDLLDIINFGVRTLVVFYRELNKKGLLEYAKSWPPDKRSKLYPSVSQELDLRFPGWKRLLKGD